MSLVQSHPLPQIFYSNSPFLFFIIDAYFYILILFIFVFVLVIVTVLKYFLELGEGDGILSETKKRFTEILYFSF